MCVPELGIRWAWGVQVCAAGGPWPSGGRAVMDSQPRLFAPATVTLVLAFLVKPLASQFVFESLPCVRVQRGWMGGTSPVPKQGGVSPAQGDLGEGPGATQVPGLGKGSRPCPGGLRASVLFFV